jgi:hypothetical protein
MPPAAPRETRINRHATAHRPAASSVFRFSSRVPHFPYNHCAGDGHRRLQDNEGHVQQFVSDFLHLSLPRIREICRHRRGALPVKLVPAHAGGGQTACPGAQTLPSRRRPEIDLCQGCADFGSLAPPLRALLTAGPPNRAALACREAGETLIDIACSCNVPHPTIMRLTPQQCGREARPCAR